MLVNKNQQQQIVALLPKAQKWAKSYSYTCPDAYDDLVSAASEGVCNAAQSYDPSQKTTFETWACSNAKWAMSDYLKSAKWEVTLTSTLPDVPDTSDEDVEQKELIDRMLDILELLPEQEKQVLKLLYGIGCEPLKAGEIAQKMGLTKGRISQIQKKALINIKNKLITND